MNLVLGFSSVYKISTLIFILFYGGLYTFKIFILVILQQLLGKKFMNLPSL